MPPRKQTAVKKPAGKSEKPAGRLTASAADKDKDKELTAAAADKDKELTAAAADKDKEPTAAGKGTDKEPTAVDKGTDKEPTAVDKAKEVGETEESTEESTDEEAISEGKYVFLNPPHGFFIRKKPRDMDQSLFLRGVRGAFQYHWDMDEATIEKIMARVQQGERGPLKGPF
jgi:hypothetical protein